MPSRRRMLSWSGGVLSLGALSVGGVWGRELLQPEPPVVPAPATVPVAVRPPLSAPPSVWPRNTLAGVNLAHLHARGRGYGSGPCRRRLERLAALGCTHVALTPFAYQKGLSDVVLHAGSDPSLTRADLVRCAADVRALGMQVVLKPHVWCPAFWSRGASRQDIAPDPAQGGWAVWFAHYTEWMRAVAALAAEVDAALLVVGLEYLRATVENPGAWADVAAACRQHYDGALSYAANWWRELELFADWGAFDHVGVNAYHPLLVAPEAPALAAAWAPHLGILGAVAQRAGKSLLMLEAGVPAVHGAQAEPWNTGAAGEEDAGLPAVYIEGLLRAALPQPWFGGVLFWKWFTDDPTQGPGGERDPYRLADRPAEQALRRWWAP